MSLDAQGRSPLRPRQLHDLRLHPAADDPRPLFVWSADQPRDFVPGPFQPYPKLLWHKETGHEITVHSAEEEQARLDDYMTLPPADLVIDPQAELSAALDLLSDEERALLLEAQRQDRLKALQAKIAALPEDKLQALLQQAESPAKRGPGRPKKAVA